MTTVTRVVNFIRAKGLNHGQFEFFLECGLEYADVPYHTGEIVKLRKSTEKVFRAA